MEDCGPTGGSAPARSTRNSGEIRVQCVETIEGDILQFIKDRIAEKDYVDINDGRYPESKSSGVNAVIKAATQQLKCWTAKSARVM